MNAISNDGANVNQLQGPQGPLGLQDDGGIHLPPILLQYWHTVLRWRWLMPPVKMPLLMALICM
ncbi:MAG: hypothetical protein RL268_223 [Pseudomonadota bacterium]